VRLICTDRCVLPWDRLRRSTRRTETRVLCDPVSLCLSFCQDLPITIAHRSCAGANCSGISRLGSLRSKLCFSASTTDPLIRHSSSAYGEARATARAGLYPLRQAILRSPSRDTRAESFSPCAGPRRNRRELTVQPKVNGSGFVSSWAHSCQGSRPAILKIGAMSLCRTPRAIHSGWLGRRGITPISIMRRPS